MISNKYLDLKKCKSNIYHIWDNRPIPFFLAFHPLPNSHICKSKYGPSDRAVQGVGLRPLAYWDWKFESCPGVWMFVSCDCCVLSGRGLCVRLITRSRSPTECGMSECDGEASIMRLWPTSGYCARGKRKSHIYLSKIFHYHKYKTGLKPFCFSGPYMVSDL
jgi:hypothetical protein